MTLDVPPGWREILSSEFEMPYFRTLTEFVDSERLAFPVYPSDADILRALLETPPDRVRVVIVGQDPYHDVGQADGLAFSVPHGMAIPPSLRNIFKELAADMPEFRSPIHGCLVPWARQGVLLLNSVLTVRAHAANSHRGRGWEEFTDAVLRSVNQSKSRVVFVLWGDHARKKTVMIDTSRHSIVASAHPSPLFSAYRGFFGSRPFSRINHNLTEAGLAPIDWRL